MDNVYNVSLVLIGIVGICVAIWIPKKIAKKQNKISEKQNELLEEQNRREQLEKRNDFYKAHDLFKRNKKNDENTFEDMQATNDKDELLVNFTHCLMPSWKIIDDDSVMYQSDEINDKFLIPCVAELRSLERLFSLDEQEKIRLGEIILKLEALDSDVDDDNITPDALKSKFKDLFQLIAESTALKTMEKQLGNN